MSKIKEEYLLVESKFVSSLRYTRDSQKLQVFYKSNSIYEYSDVAPKVINKIKKAKSIGKAMHKYVFKTDNFKKL
jgi:hypothetical protein